MKIAIVDDEKKATDILDTYIQRFEQEFHVEIFSSIFHNPNDFLNSYSSDYDLVFLDVEMPGLNGIETAKEMRKMDPNVVLIFITNMAQYALSGYEVQALDFVIKPVAYADFSMKLQKAIRYVKRNEEHKITLATSDGMVHLMISDIFYIEVMRHYLVYHTSSGDYTVRGVMKVTEKDFEQYHFVRSNHSYLVNLKYVEAISGNCLRVAGTELLISRNKKNEFMEAFARYVGGMK